MDIRNRMDDVVALRSHALQDYFDIVLVPDWREKLYTQAERYIDEHSPHADKYRPAYDKMREIGRDNYLTTDMDVSLMSTIAIHMSWILSPPPNQKTKSAIKQLAEDRNITNHASSNEEQNELYLRGLVALCNLQSFIKAIDRGENMIPLEQRTPYYQKYMAEIKKLMNLIDDERFDLIGRQREIDRDIKAIQNSSNPQRAWLDYWKSYALKKKETKDLDILDEFCIRSSEAGIEMAHSHALLHYSIIAKDWEESVQCIRKIFSIPDKSPGRHIYDVLPVVNWGIRENLPHVNELVALIENERAKDCKIHKDADGTYHREN